MSFVSWDYQNRKSRIMIWVQRRRMMDIIIYWPVNKSSQPPMSSPESRWEEPALTFGCFYVAVVKRRWGRGCCSWSNMESSRRLHAALISAFFLTCSFGQHVRTGELQSLSVVDGFIYRNWREKCWSGFDLTIRVRAAQHLLCRNENLRNYLQKCSWEAAECSWS